VAAQGEQAVGADRQTPAAPGGDLGFAGITIRLDQRQEVVTAS
jgi:hypothetical protein